MKPALAALHTRLDDARRLIEIHDETTGIAAGRRYNFDALNRASVILSMAAWEGFVEDLLKYSSKFIATRLDGPSDFPQSIRETMLYKLHLDGNWGALNASTKSGIWSLAGSGWRAAYVGYATSRIRGLNTPNVENVGKLFKTVVGLSDFAQDWGARRWDRETYVNKLNDALTLRHRIAHGTIGTETVGKTRARNALSVVTKVAGWTTGTVDAHLHAFPLRPKPLVTKALRSAIVEMHRQITS